MRRSSVLGICAIAVLVTGAVPASAKTTIVLETKQGGITQAGAPVLLGLEVRADIGPFCYAKVTGSIAVNGKTKDKVTFPAVEFTKECSEQGETAAFAGHASTLEISKSGVKLTANLKDTVSPGPCLYSFPSRISFSEAFFAPLSGEKEVPVRRVEGSRSACFQGFGYMSFILSDPQNGEYFEAVRG
jgi:hypothetical protein